MPVHSTWLAGVATLLLGKRSGLDACVGTKRVHQPPKAAKNDMFGGCGFCAGIIVAGGVSGLLIGLSIVPRYAGITHTADCIFLYEDSSLLGTVAGTIVTLFPVRIPLGPFFLAVCGVFFGIFLGGWILALAEIAKVFPVFARRLKFTQGLSLVIVSIAAGKTLGSLFYYAKGWM